MSAVVSPLLQAAFAQAATANRDRLDRWRRVSHKIGGALPQSLLTATVQNCGRLDVLVTTLETEASETLDPEIYIQSMLSELWVSQLYEICRLIRDRRLEPWTKNHVEFFKKVELLRMVFDKHEIANDKNLADDLKLYSVGDRGSIYIYRKTDKKRSHIMPAGSSARGSMMWQALAHDTHQSQWIERRALSDEFLELHDVAVPQK